jgi:hypothetical protein
MAKTKLRYTVFAEMNISNLQNEIVAQRFANYFSSDSLAMAESVAASLQRINHAYRITEGTKILKEWIHEGFHASN